MLLGEVMLSSKADAQPRMPPLSTANHSPYSWQLHNITETATCLSLPRLSPINGDKACTKLPGAFITLLGLSNLHLSRISSPQTTDIEFAVHSTQQLLWYQSTCMRSRRMQRPSLALYNKLSARPQRLPFLKHALDDEFLAAYLGYDKVDDFDRFRFSPFMVAVFSNVEIEFPKSDRCSQYRTITYLLQYNDSQLDKKPSKFCVNVYEDLGELDSDAMARCVLLVGSAEVLGKFGVSRLDVSSDRILQQRQTFIDFLAEECGVTGVFDLPWSVRAFQPPVIREFEGDLEGSLRIAALLESMKANMKPRVWKRKYPATVDEMPAWDRLLSWV